MKEPPSLHPVLSVIPGNDSWTATVDFGDGSGVQALSLNANKTFDLSHTYANDGLYTVEVVVDDDDAGTHSDSFIVTVSNVAPTPTINDVPAGAVPEGSLIVLTSTSSDPGINDVITFSWSVTKDGNPYTTIDPGTNSFFSFTPNDDGLYEVTLVASDELNSGQASETIQVDNVSPSGTLSGAPATSPEGSVISLTGVFTDPGADNLSYTFTVTKDGNPFASSSDPTLSAFNFTPDDQGSLSGYTRRSG